MSEKLLYEELTPREFLARLEQAPIAYLPLGTLEWHGEHLPLGSDGIQSRGFFLRLAERVGGIVMPMLFVGPDSYKMVDGQELYGMDMRNPGSGNHLDQQLPGSAYWVGTNLFVHLLHEILMRLKRAGFRIVVAHGHGPSGVSFAANMGKWSKELGLQLFHCWREDESDGMGIQTDHAAANETSLMMALRPDLVHMENLDQNPDIWPLAVSGNDPRTRAGADLGEKAIEAQLERMTNLLNEALKDIKAAPGGESNGGV
jgi:creatinine amidohydrolase